MYRRWGVAATIVFAASAAIWLWTFQSYVLMVPYLVFPLHLASLAVGLAVFYVARPDPKVPTLRVLKYLLQRFPLWLVPLIIVTAVAFDGLYSTIRTPEGREIGTKHIAAEDGKYYLELNDRRVREVSLEEFQQFETEGARAFATGWMALSLLAMVNFLWVIPALESLAPPKPS